MFIDDNTVVVLNSGERFPEALFDTRGRPLGPRSVRTMEYDASVPRDARALLLVNPTAGQLAVVAAGAPAGARVLVLVDAEYCAPPFSIVNGV
ncbi:hypothetical protein BVTX09c5_092 [Bovine papular stomatitis virus]|uniref:Uncharacterized protein n=1 Tax=Bovine papular stomatitis virus TaxID=129727 RepID=A0A0E3T7L5_9POXV|nr:hypothetical protein BVTX09c15_092 [Bovine papular stomatitis virus]AKC03390.1 hypothetical protein BVTX09c5_092 [Bovine papular stomatitis virus]